MEQHALKNVNNNLNTNIFTLTFGGQSSNLFLNVAQFFMPVLIRHLWQLKTVVFLHWSLIFAILLSRQHKTLMLSSRYLFLFLHCLSFKMNNLNSIRFDENYLFFLGRFIPGTGRRSRWGFSFKFSLYFFTILKIIFFHKHFKVMYKRLTAQSSRVFW